MRTIENGPTSTGTEDPQGVVIACGGVVDELGGVVRAGACEPQERRTLGVRVLVALNQDVIGEAGLLFDGGRDRPAELASEELSDEEEVLVGELC